MSAHARTGAHARAHTCTGAGRGTGTWWIHQQGFIHRDIKPANIFLEDANADNVMLGDFGLSKSQACVRACVSESACVGACARVRVRAV